MARTSLEYGQYKGQPLTQLPTRYIVWCASQALHATLYPDSIRAAIAELRRRFADPGRLEAELVGDVPAAARDLI